MKETDAAIPPVDLPPESTIPPAPLKKGLFANVYEAIAALFLLVGTGIAMAGFFAARFLFRWLLWFPLNILQTALYIILFYLRNFAALVLALLLVAGGIGYFLDVSLDVDLGIERIANKLGTYISKEKTPEKTFTTLASITQKEHMPRELDPILDVPLSPEEINAFADIISTGKLGLRGEGAIPLISRLLYRQDEKTRTAAYETLRRIGTPQAIQAINDYYAAAKKGANGKNTGR